MAKKPEFKKLKKHVKALNKLELTDKIDLSDFDEDELDELSDAFVSAIEDIDENGKTKKVTKTILKYYNDVVFDYVDSKDKDEDSDNKEETDNDKVKAMLNDLDDAEDNDDLEEFLEDNDLDEDDVGYDEDNSFKKNVKAVKGYLNGLMKDEEEPEEDEPEETEEDEPEETEEEIDWDDVEDMSWKEVRNFAKEHGIKTKDIGLKKSDWEDDEEECTEKIKKAFNKLNKKKDKKEKNKKKKDKDKKTNKKKDKEKEDTDDVKLPKGWKKDSVNSKMYMLIAEGDASIKDLAIMLNKGKKAGSDKLYKKVVHTVARVLTKDKAMSITFNGGGDDDGVVNFAE